MKINSKHEFKNLIKQILLEDGTPGNAPGEKQVHVFDFDDTLGVTDNPNGVMPYLDGQPLLKSEEDAKKWLQQNGLSGDLLAPKNGPAIQKVEKRGGFAVYLSSSGLAKIQSKLPRDKQKVTGVNEPSPEGESLLIDFTPSSFVDQKSTKPIGQTIDKLKKANSIGAKTAVMTARKGEGSGTNFSGEKVPNTNSTDIKDFLSKMGAEPNSGVIGVSGQNKGNAIKQKFDSMNPEELHFYDDLSKNTSEVDNALANDKDKEVYIYGPGEFAHGQASAEKPNKIKKSEKPEDKQQIKENIIIKLFNK